MELLRKKIKTKAQVLSFIDKLILLVKDKSKYNSLDGFIIGLIYANSKFICSIILSDDTLPPMSDNAIQQLEQCVIWLSNNEKDLIKL